MTTDLSIPPTPSTPPTLVDTHVHVFHARLPMVAERRYTPVDDALPDGLAATMAADGATVAWLVQPSFLGTDNAYLLRVLDGRPERFRGVVVVDPADGMEAARLRSMAARGAIGLRLNLDGQPLPDLAGAEWRSLLAAVRRLGWHVALHRHATDLPRLIGPLVDAGVDVVVDHFGRPDAPGGVDGAGFRFLLDAASSRRVWVKLSAPYRIGEALADEAAAALGDAFGAERLLWGSDWPHTRHESAQKRTPQAALAAWFADPVARRAVAGGTAVALAARAAAALRSDEGDPAGFAAPGGKKT